MQAATGERPYLQVRPNHLIAKASLALPLMCCLVGRGSSLPRPCETPPKSPVGRVGSKGSGHGPHCQAAACSSQGHMGRWAGCGAAWRPRLAAHLGSRTASVRPGPVQWKPRGAQGDQCPSQPPPRLHAAKEFRD